LALAGAVGAAVVLGLLSRKLGRVTHARPYYLGFFAAAFLVAVAVIARLFDLGGLESVVLAWLVYDGFPAAGVTLGVLFAWHYWSWLLAERD
jgi:hypothetical protein